MLLFDLSALDCIALNFLDFLLFLFMLTLKVCSFWKNGIAQALQVVKFFPRKNVFHTVRLLSNAHCFPLVCIALQFKIIKKKVMKYIVEVIYLPPR